MEKIDVATARKAFAEIIKRASEGEQFVVTRYGQEMALIGPANENPTWAYIDYIQRVHDEGRK